MKCKHCDGTGTTNWCVNGTFLDCPYCGGTGEIEVEQEQMTERVKIKCDDCKFEPECADYGWLGCKKITPAPSEPQTNEVWFCSLPTEEKAEWLIEFAIRFIPNELTVLSEKIKTYKNNILVWLKQPHN